ncbi:hypothetical protein HHK36_009885 [Tetracentron sinense]|uniref:Uncharacterized protein n=1 Tax=Tetracentron sinense TaxID=13715 RepID=A0A834ZDG9_TETSI|nr:hypothetical protein HHK36_009885 [Tetracentron sinense]
MLNVYNNFFFFATDHAVPLQLSCLTASSSSSLSSSGVIMTRCLILPLLHEAPFHMAPTDREIVCHCGTHAVQFLLIEYGSCVVLLLNGVFFPSLLLFTLVVARTLNFPFHSSSFVGFHRSPKVLAEHIDSVSNIPLFHLDHIDTLGKLCKFVCNTTKLLSLRLEILDQLFVPLQGLMSYGNTISGGERQAVTIRTRAGLKYDGKVTVYPGHEGGGSIDLIVCLLPETMSALESDEEFMEYVPRFDDHKEYVSW